MQCCTCTYVDTCVYVYICTYVGNYLFDKLKESKAYEVCFVWNRTANKMDGVVPVDLILDNLRQVHTRYVRNIILVHLRRKYSPLLG